MASTTASAQTPAECPSLTILQSIGDDVDAMQINAIAVVNFVPRGTEILIWRAEAEIWVSGVAGNLLAAGDAIWLTRSVRPAIIRIMTDHQSRMSPLHNKLKPFLLEGAESEQLSPGALNWFNSIDWPSPHEIAAFEHNVVSSGRARTDPML